MVSLAETASFDKYWYLNDIESANMLRGNNTCDTIKNVTSAENNMSQLCQWTLQST